MMDRETVISKLQILRTWCAVNPDYNTGLSAEDCVKAVGWLDDALALLKAQEPRVMTLDEVKQERICWIEDADDGMTIRLFPATMFGICEYASGSKSYMFLAQKPWAIDANDCEWWYLIEDYGQTWRCWTSRPTDEQREATPWQQD